MKFKIPRKKKKTFKKYWVYQVETFTHNKFTWFCHKRMHLTRNYILAGIDIEITKERLTWIKNGLLNPNWKDYVQ